MNPRCGAGCGRFVKAGRAYCEGCAMMPASGLRFVQDAAAQAKAEVPDLTLAAMSPGEYVLSPKHRAPTPKRRTKWFRLFGRKESL